MADHSPPEERHLRSQRDTEVTLAMLSYRLESVENVTAQHHTLLFEEKPSVIGRLDNHERRLILLEERWEAFNRRMWKVAVAVIIAIILATATTIWQFTVLVQHLKKLA